PSVWPTDRSAELGRVRTMREGGDLLMLTFGNGVRMSLRAANRLAERGIEAEVVDLQWLAPLPVAAIMEKVGTDRPVLVVDETRRSGGVSESVITALVEQGHRGPLRRVAS